jgi:alpha-tubulin suppressor-like RCC1 family protein
MDSPERRACAWSMAPSAVLFLAISHAVIALGCEAEPREPPASSCDTTPLSGSTSDPVGRVMKLSAGSHNACALIEDGSMRCWGDNSHGQIGDGSLVSGRYPTRTSNAPAMQQLVIGAGSMCALSHDHCAWCWGDNSSGQLGTGELGGPRTPELNKLLRGVLHLAMFRRTSAAITPLQPLWWGEVEGQFVRAPRLVADRKQYRSIDVGQQFGCGLRHDRHVECWGENDYGQLGTGDTVDQTEPVEVEGLSDVTDVIVGNVEVYVIRSDGTLWCWGNNFFGQLGDGTEVDRATPGQVALQNVVEVSIYSGHVCALTDAGSVYCWGNNSSREVGNGAKGDHVLEPWEIPAVQGARAIATGGSFSCILRDDHDVQCWGYNKLGELGDGTFTNSSTPVKVAWEGPPP